MRKELTDARCEVTQTPSLVQKHERMCRSFLQDETRDFVGFTVCKKHDQSVKLINYRKQVANVSDAE